MLMSEDRELHQQPATINQ